MFKFLYISYYVFTVFIERMGRTASSSTQTRLISSSSGVTRCKKIQKPRKKSSKREKERYVHDCISNHYPKIAFYPLFVVKTCVA